MTQAVNVASDCTAGLPSLYNLGLCNLMTKAYAESIKNFDQATALVTELLGTWH